MIFFQIGPLHLVSIDAGNKKYSEDYFKSKLSIAEWEASKRFKHELRRREFLAGRTLLHALDDKLPPVLSTDTGMPIWDTDFVGSLSHKNGWVVACLASTQRYRGIGIDLEEPLKFPIEVAGVICVPEEFPKNRMHTGFGQSEILALIFSCKESLFKACYPICKIWFGFQDARLLSFNLEAGVFEIELLRDLLPEFKNGQIFTGHFKQPFGTIEIS